MAARRPSGKPTLRVERALQREGHRLLAGDGRGRPRRARRARSRSASSSSTRPAGPRPQGVKDSKLLDRRTPASGWCRGSGAGRRPTPSGTPAPDEIDAIGIIAALRLAGQPRAGPAARRTRPGDPRRQPRLADRPARVGPVRARSTRRAACRRRPPVTHHDQGRPEVLVGGRRQRAGQGGARRDHGRRSPPEYPVYAWADNKGYSAPEHLEALRLHGPCEHHRGPGGCPGCRARGRRRAAGPRDEDPWPDESAGGRGRPGRRGRGHEQRRRGPDVAPTGAPGAGDGSAVSDPPAMGDDGRVWEVSVP